MKHRTATIRKSMILFFTALVAISALVGCADDNKKTSKNWQVKPLLKRPEGYTTELKSLTQNDHLSITTADVIEFETLQEEIFLEVKTSCRTSPEQRFEHQWRGTVAQRLQVLTLLPREILFSQGRLGPMDTLCEFKFVASNKSGHRHRFDIAATPVVAHANDSLLQLTPDSNSISEGENKNPFAELPSPESGDDYSIACEGLKLDFKSVQIPSQSSLVQEILAAQKFGEEITLNPQQNCRLFKMADFNVAEMSQLFTLSFPPPQLHVEWQVATSAPMLSKNRPYSAELARVLVHNRSAHFVILRLPNSVSRGLNLEIHRTAGGVSTAIGYAQTGFRILPVDQAPETVRAEGQYVKITPWDQVQFRLLTDFKMGCSKYFGGFYIRPEPDSEPRLEMVAQLPEEGHPAPPTEALWKIPVPFQLWVPANRDNPPVRKIRKKRSMACHPMPILP